MASITRYLSTKKDSNGKAEVMLRLTVRRGLQCRLHTNMYLQPSRFSDGKIIMPRLKSADHYEIVQINRRIQDMENYLLDICLTEDVQLLTYEYITLRATTFLSTYNKPKEEGASVSPKTPKKQKKAQPLADVLHPEPASKSESTKDSSIFDTFKEYMVNKNVSEGRKARYKVVYRTLSRYEQYMKLLKGNKYRLGLKSFTVEDAKHFEKFLREEHEICKKYPGIYAKQPLDDMNQRTPPKPAQRGDNTIVSLLRCLRGFFHYCMSKSYIAKDPFLGFDGTNSERYGTPFYISIEERDQIADFDLSKSKALEVQRDIFIFQTLIGCRVSDLMRLTPKDIINGIVEYIPKKTKHERATVVRVPLNQRGLDILEKYKGVDPEGRILPFISTQKYNDAIKKIFKKCGITRMVTVLDPVSGEEVKRPMDEIASSHLARRTFVGNLYKKVKDPNLVGALSGHAEGSKAFARYREIDDDIKKELISYLD